MAKEQEAEILKTFYEQMATPSLSPDDFLELERILSVIAQNRSVTFTPWPDND